MYVQFGLKNDDGSRTSTNYIEQARFFSFVFPARLSLRVF